MPVPETFDLKGWKLEKAGPLSRLLDTSEFFTAPGHVQI